MSSLVGYGLELVPLTEDHLELVRSWRNAEHVKLQMDYQQFISFNQQKQWFDSLQNAHYFMIKTDKEWVGLINLKEVDYQSGEAESGLFIGETKYLGTGVSLGASLLLLEYAFTVLQLNGIRAKISKENYEAIKYNELLGFKWYHELDQRFSCWRLIKDDFLKRKNKLLALLH